LEIEEDALDTKSLMGSVLRGRGELMSFDSLLYGLFITFGYALHEPTVHVQTLVKQYAELKFLCIKLTLKLLLEFWLGLLLNVIHQFSNISNHNLKMSTFH
jgi:hypothetical protein